MNHKITARKEERILRELTLILNREFDNPHLNAVTISEVRLSRDNSQAKIYFSFIPFQNTLTRHQVERALIENQKTIRMLLAGRLEMRSVPELVFEYDTVLQKANRIEAILKNSK